MHFKDCLMRNKAINGYKEPKENEDIPEQDPEVKSSFLNVLPIHYLETYF